MDAVLNWIWQGSVVALAAAGMLRLLDPARAHLRYRALWIVLAAILVLPLSPLLWAAAPVSAIPALPEPRNLVIPLPEGWWLSGAIVLGAAAAWALMSAGRVVAAGVSLQRARRACRSFPEDVEARLTHWCQVRATGRPAQLVLSDAVKSAAVLAGRSPLIALAPAIVTALTDDELDRVVVHEWAHVQRRDDSAHLLQLLVRTCAGWHPAVWWCDRRLHLEREVACDEMVVAITGSAKAYAACLARLAALPSPPLRPLQAVALLSGSTLRHRVIRILSLERMPSRRGRPGTAIGAPMLICVFALIVGGYRPVAAVPAAAESAARAFAESLGATTRAEAVPSPEPGPRTARGDAPRGAAEAAQRGLPVGDRNAAVDDEGPSARPESRQAAVATALPQNTLADTRAPAGQTAAPLSSRPGLAADMFDPSLAVAGAGPVMAVAAENAASSPARPVSPWTSAADAGVAVGGGAQDAARATAGFFNRLGRTIADSF